MISNCIFVFTFEFLFCISVAASGNNVFTSPETSKTFEFSSEEKIYKWYLILLKYWFGYRNVLWEHGFCDYSDDFLGFGHFILGGSRKATSNQILTKEAPLL